MVPVYTVENLEVHPHDEHVQPGLCYEATASPLQRKQTDCVPDKNVVKRQEELMSCTSTTCDDNCEGVSFTLHFFRDIKYFL